MLAELAAWTLAAMAAFSGRDPTPYMRRLAADVAAVSHERPALGNAARTAALLASISASESGGFRDEVMDCRVNGDHGHSITAFQLHYGPPSACSMWMLAAKVALDRVESSLRRCGTLAEYTSGHCDRGVAIAKRYMERARKYAADHPMTIDE